MNTELLKISDALKIIKAHGFHIRKRPGAGYKLDHKINLTLKEVRDFAESLLRD